MHLTIIIQLGRDSREIFSSELRYLVAYLLVICQYLNLIEGEYHYLSVYVHPKHCLVLNSHR